ncbi:hypothetical protein Tco_0291400 [Tanacetum coccineum]
MDAVQPPRSCFAKIKNIDGKVLGKDGKPIKALRNVHFEADADTSVPVNDLPMQSATESLSENDSNIGSTSKVAILEDVQVEPAIFCKRLAFPIVENYVKNVWAKYGIERVMLQMGYFFSLFLFLRWNGIVWVKLHNVPIVTYYEIGLSLLTTQLGKPIMLDRTIQSGRFIQNGSGHVSFTTDTKGQLRSCLPEMQKFYSRESPRKMQKYILKANSLKGFSVYNSEGLSKVSDRFPKAFVSVRNSMEKVYPLRMQIKDSKILPSAVAMISMRINKVYKKNGRDRKLQFVQKNQLELVLLKPTLNATIAKSGHFARSAESRNQITGGAEHAWISRNKME